jgi:hypothetical protein
MFRFAILLSLIFLPSITSRNDDFSPCADELAKSTYCLNSVDLEIDEAVVSLDANACNECYAKYDKTTVSCSTAISIICGCHDVCNPILTFCQEEYNAFTECFQAVSYAPDGCSVQCNNGMGDTNSNTSPSASTPSSASMSSNVPMPLVGSSIIMAVVMTGSRF